MNKGLSEVKLIPLRIKQARSAREYTLDNLAADLGITKQMVSKYESGASKPDINTLSVISKTLDFPIEFFYKPVLMNASASPIFFRSTQIPKKKQDAMEQKIIFAYEIVQYIEQYIDLPEFDNPIESKNLLYTDGAFEEIEALSFRLRTLWGLGGKPVNNLTNLLLRKGYIITRSYNNSDKIDAYSKSLLKPYIVLGSDKNCCVRSRFDLSHELGHIIMHHNIISEAERNKYHRSLESQANRFASAFLMPASSFSKDIGSISLESFVCLKRKWKVSISAIVRRCYDLNLVDKEQYTLLNKIMSSRGWKQSEPLDDVLECERPELFKQAFDLILENKLDTASECLRELALDPSLIETLCFLDEGYFSRTLNESPSPKLKVIK